MQPKNLEGWLKSESFDNVFKLAFINLLFQMIIFIIYFPMSQIIIHFSRSFT